MRHKLSIVAALSFLAPVSVAYAQECPDGCASACCEGKETEAGVKTVARQDEDRAKAHELFMAGKMEESAQLLAKVCEGGEGKGVDWFRLGYALHMTGDVDRALEAHEKAAEYAQFRPIALYNVGCARALKGEIDQAFEALQRSAEVGFAMADHIQSDSDLDSLRSDERWSAFVKRVEHNADVDEKQNAMDFLVGSWTLTFQGEEVGVSTVERSVGGNCVTEDWASERYGMGKSMYFYEASSDSWRHVAIGLNAEVLDMKGADADGKMVFKGKDDDGAFRQVFARESGGQVSLTMERKGKDSEGYTTEWTVVYVPREGAEESYAETAEAVSLR